MKRASVVSRLLAFLIDLFFLGCVSALLFVAATAGALIGAGAGRPWGELLPAVQFLAPLIFLFKLFLFFFYFTYLTAGDERTIGKMLFGIKVVRRADGEPPGTVRALVRTAGYIVSAVPFLMGFWMALLTGGRAAHDLIAGTMVVKE
jgi:uncharacterized RDD family membrane protein YckC